MHFPKQLRSKRSYTILFQIGEVEVSGGMQYPERILMLMSRKNDYFKITVVNDSSIEEESEIKVFVVTVSSRSTAKIISAKKNNKETA